MTKDTKLRDILNSLMGSDFVEVYTLDDCEHRLRKSKQYISGTMGVLHCVRPNGVTVNITFSEWLKIERVK